VRTLLELALTHPSTNRTRCRVTISIETSRVSSDSQRARPPGSNRSSAVARVSDSFDRHTTVFSDTGAAYRHPGRRGIVGASLDVPVHVRHRFEHDGASRTQHIALFQRGELLRLRKWLPHERRRLEDPQVRPAAWLTEDAEELALDRPESDRELRGGSEQNALVDCCHRYARYTLRVRPTSQVYRKRFYVVFFKFLSQFCTFSTFFLLFRRFYNKKVLN